MIIKVLPIVLVVLLAACAGPEKPDSTQSQNTLEPETSDTAPVPDESRAKPPSEQAQPESVAKPKPPAVNKAVDALLVAAKQSFTGDRVAQAAATLERAIRIDPRDSRSWGLLAKVREKQGDLAQAADLAEKSNALGAAVYPQLAKENWALIARVRKHFGDLVGAKAAEQKAK